MLYFCAPRVSSGRGISRRWVSVATDGHLVPYNVPNRRDAAVVIISLEDYESLIETSYLLKSPRNARRLLESIQELEEGKGTPREPVE